MNTVYKQKITKNGKCFIYELGNIEHMWTQCISSYLENTLLCRFLGNIRQLLVLFLYNIILSTEGDGLQADGKQRAVDMTHIENFIEGEVRK